MLFSSMKYAKCSNATDISQVENFMDRLVGGDMQFNKLTRDIFHRPSHEEV